VRPLTFPALNTPHPARPTRSRLSHLAAGIAIAAVYVVTARAGLLLDPVAGFAAFVWPPTGIALAAAILMGNRVAPAIFAGAFVANTLSGAPVLAAFAIAAGNTLEAIGGAWILRRFQMDRCFVRVRDASLFLAVVAFVPVLSATVGVASLRAAGILASTQTVYAWEAWWVGDAIGALMFAPPILVWWPPRSQDARPGRRGQLAVTLFALALVSTAVFFGRVPEPTSFLGAYLVFPVLLWTTVRHEQRGVTLAVLLTGLVAIAGTVNNTGPFAQGVLGTSLFTLQTFMGVVGATFLFLATALAERGTVKRIAEADAAQQVTQARERAAEFLSRASAVLASSLDYNVTLDRLSQLVVPELVDWCAIDTVTAEGTLRRVAVVHQDPAKLQLARDLGTRHPTDMNAPTGAPYVLRTGNAELHQDITDAQLVAAARDAEHLRILRELGLRSAMVVPIAARDRVHGVLTLVSSESGRRFTQADLELAKELGRRAGLAIENSLLLAEVRAAADRMSRLQGVTSRLASVLNDDEIGDVVLAAGIEALGAFNGVLCVLSDECNALEI
jgi:integral membrane sensor domain MASE1